ncbi:hypothetical protein C8J57DRAFT_1595652 [Mycena rebaudengoi]|nr:hypothetical protein C8J57DRAFT_1595652 [Mycena rebaudengoi]
MPSVGASAESAAHGLLPNQCAVEANAGMQEEERREQLHSRAVEANWSGGAAAGVQNYGKRRLIEAASYYLHTGLTHTQVNPQVCIPRTFKRFSGLMGESPYRLRLFPSFSDSFPCIHPSPLPSLHLFFCGLPLSNEGHWYVRVSGVGVADFFLHVPTDTDVHVSADTQTYTSALIRGRSRPHVRWRARLDANEAGRPHDSTSSPPRALALACGLWRTANSGRLCLTRVAVSTSRGALRRAFLCTLSPSAVLLRIVSHAQPPPTAHTVDLA